MNIVDLVTYGPWYVIAIVCLTMIISQQSEIKYLKRKCDTLRKEFDSQTKLLNARDEYLKSKNKLVDDLVGEHLRVCERLDMLEELEKERQNNEQV